MGLIQILVFFASLGLGALLVMSFGLQRNQHGEVEGVRIGPVVAAVLIVIGALFLNSSFGEISAGERGVVVSFGKVTGQTLNPGLYTIMPVVQSVVRCNVQVQALSTQEAAVSSNLQDVKTNITVNFRQRPESCVGIVRDLGNDLAERIIKPGVQESVRAATAQYTAEELIQKRPLVRDTMEKLMAARFTVFGADTSALSITNFEFSQGYTQAIEQKAVVDQQVQQARLELERVAIQAQQKVKQAEADRDANIATATGEARAIRLKGEAQAQALAAQRAQLTPELVQKLWVDKWDGTVPQTMLGSGGANFLFTLPSKVPAK